jgi:iron(III) transport system substrate-binding protein
MSSHSPSRNNNRRLALIALVLLVAVLIPILIRSSTDTETVVLYCAHDSIFADAIIQEFEKRTGVHVQVRYDEEASKSLGLSNLLIAERDNPRCDVFWNNQTLGTIRLKDEGVLAPCPPDVFARIPGEHKDPDHCWAGFAGRLRVYIVNTQLLSATDEAIAERLNSDSLSRVAIAMPLYGTTLTHYSLLANQMGLDQLKEWHASLHQRGIREARGNGSVKDLVADGACDLGFTDTDDVFVALDAKKPVDMRPIRLPSGQSICIPNSVALIRNGPHPDAAMKLIQYLISEEVELELANSASRQIPLGAVDSNRIPADVQRLTEWAKDAVSMDGVPEQQTDVLLWLLSRENAEENP